MSDTGIELTNQGVLQEELENEAKLVLDSAVSPVSLNTLFFSLSSRKEQVMMWIGYLCSFISGILSPIAYIFFGLVMDEMNKDEMNSIYIQKTLFLFASILILSSIFATLERFFLGYYAEHVTERYRNEYLKAVLSHDIDYIVSFSPGQLGQRFADESSKIYDGLGPSLGLFIRSLSSLFCGVIIGFCYSWELTICSLITLPFIVYFSYKFSKGMGYWNLLWSKEHMEEDSLAEESFRNIRTVASLGAENTFIKRYEKVINDCCSLAVDVNRVCGLSVANQSLSNQLANILLFLSSFLLVYFQRKDYPSLLWDAGCIIEDYSPSVSLCFTSTDLSNDCQAICNQVSQCWYEAGQSCLVGGEVIIVFYSLLNSFSGIGNSFTSLQALERSRMAASMFLHVINHKDKEEKNKQYHQPSSNHGLIKLSDVCFEYSSRSQLILNHLNLSIHDNEMIGIVGESGCGKSTILKLLMKLYYPSSGTISWNSIQYESIDATWIRNQIAYVSQEPLLFSTTIKNNIKYGCIGCSDEEMIEVAKIVGADSFIQSFPKGYDTYVGELGTSLSGGQKQRIALARALLRHPRLLLLDEATSALDTKTEEIIQNALMTIREQSKVRGESLSILVVAHRLNSIQQCDRILVLEDGAIKEEGNHDELLAKKGLYYSLYNAQYEEENESEEKEKEKELVEDTTRYSFLELIHFMGKKQKYYWFSYFGTFMRLFFPAVYAFGSAQLQSILYSFNIQSLFSIGWKVLLLILAFALISYIGTIINWYYNGVAAEHLIATIRSTVYAKLINIPVSYFDEPTHLPSIITSRLSIDARRIRDMTDKYGRMIENIVFAILALLLCFSSTGYWKLALVAIALSPFLLTIEYFQWKMVYKITGKIDSMLTEKAGILTDYILNIHTIHAYNLKDVIYHEVRESLQEIHALGKARTTRGAIGQGLSLFFPSVYMIVVVVVGSFFIEKGEMNFNQLLVVMSSITMAAQSISFNIVYSPNYKLSEESTNHVISILHSPNENETYREVKTEATNGDIQFKHVSFTYPTRQDHPIFKDISFTIPKDSSVAFVGPSGCGKSTITSLIQRLYSPVNGSILINSQDVKQVNLDSYRSLMGCVNQEPCMFSGTIRENLVMGVDRDVSKEELESICKQTLCMEFINEMPDGFETDLGTTGKAVSGGQKQRLALARALLRNPQILLLDEATSALDSENQEKFLNALNEWRKSHPCIVITVAHRLSTIVESDIIFVINEGQLIASGKHEELLQNCPFYNSLVAAQMNS